MIGRSELAPFLKEYWTENLKNRVRYEKHPFFAMIKKNTSAGGENCVVPIDVDDGGEGSATFSDAQATAVNTASIKRQFVIDWAEDFELAQVSNAAMRASRNKEHALEKAVKETERAQRKLADRIARSIYRAGWGEKGVVGSSTNLSSKVIRLSNASDARFFHVGDKLVFSSSLNAATLRDSGDYVSVTKIDVDTGDITTDAGTDLSTSITSIAAGDYIFNKGSRQNSATPSRLVIPGLAAWNPDSAPTAGESFFGVDRTTYTSRLAGLRYPASGNASGALQETLIRALAHAGINQCDITHGFIHPTVYADLLVALEGQKGIRETTVSVGKIGFTGIEVATGYTRQPVKLFSDGDCPAGRGYFVNLDSVELLSLGETIQNDLLSNGSNGEAGRDIENASGMEFRYVFHGTMAATNPGDLLVVKFS